MHGLSDHIIAFQEACDSYVSKNRLVHNLTDPHVSGFQKGVKDQLRDILMTLNLSLNNDLKITKAEDASNTNKKRIESFFKKAAQKAVETDLSGSIVVSARHTASLLDLLRSQINAAALPTIDYSEYASGREQGKKEFMEKVLPTLIQDARDQLAKFDALSAPSNNSPEQRHYLM